MRPLASLLILVLLFLALILAWDAGVWLGAHLWGYAPDPWYA